MRRVWNAWRGELRMEPRTTSNRSLVNLGRLGALRCTPRTRAGRLRTSSHAGTQTGIMECVRFFLKICSLLFCFHLRYSDFGCQHGQHCLGGVCYENATVCLCNDKDNCNDFLADGGGQTPHPYEPSTPKDKHKCYYGNSDDQSSSLVQEQECHKGENLCVRVTKEDKDDPFEFRSCWSGE